MLRNFRIAVGILLVLNIAGAALVLFPAGGSAEMLEQQLTALQTQVLQKTVQLDRTRQNLASMEKARGEGDHFLNDYFLSRRTAYSTLLAELMAAARTSQIKPREHAYSTEPIEGSTAFSMMTITANYEGTYKELMSFVNQIDRSPRLLVIESLNAAPQQGSGNLTISMKIDTFVREDGGL